MLPHLTSQFIRTSKLIHQMKHVYHIFKHGKLSMSNMRYCSRSLMSNTIFALSSGMGKCGVAVIRISGPRSKFAVRKLIGNITKPKVASLRKLVHPVSGEMLDKAIILWFPGPSSVTGEDCAEFHVHGGPAVITSVLEALSCLPGLQYAKAGEFTKQAFINGKMDLTEVEGLGDLIHAETEAQRKQALRQMDGDLGQLYSSWRMKLIKCLANCEAFIDFSEEENIEDDVLDVVQEGVMDIEKEVSCHLQDSRCGERLRNGVHIAILGQPNAGKSSLLNIMTRRPAAIVSPIAGTTRDVVETALNFSGYPVVISDTAGLRLTDDEVEKEGVKRALDKARSADLKILLFDGIHQEDCLKTFSSKSNLLQKFLRDFYSDFNVNLSLTQSDSDIPVKQWDHGKSLSLVDGDSAHVDTLFSEQDTVIVVNKQDLISDVKYLEYLQNLESIQVISCKTGQGVNEFLETLTKRIKTLCGNPLEGPPSLTQSRHRAHLSACLDFLKEFHRLQNVDFVLATERLRLAAREIGQITGGISAEDVLDVLFQDFCIGK